MAQTLYKGRNGLLYLTPEDAEIDGGGLVSENISMDTVERKVQLTPKQKERVKSRKKNLDVVFDLNGSFEDSNDEEVVAVEAPAEPLTEEPKKATK